MKSLSPNAQEFVPLITNPTAVHPSAAYYLVNDNGGSPIVQLQPTPFLGHSQMGQVQFGFLNQNASIGGSVSPIAAAGAIVYMQPQQVSHSNSHSNSQFSKQITTIGSTSAPSNGAQSYPVYYASGDHGASMSPILVTQHSYPLLSTKSNAPDLHHAQSTVTYQVRLYAKKSVTF